MRRMTAKLHKEVSLDSQGQASTCGSLGSTTVASSMKLANILVDENIQVDMLTETITYDSDDEMVTKRSSVLRNKKGHPIYSREDIREQYCITTKELESIERARCSKLFSCFTSQEICSKKFTPFSCIQKLKTSEVKVEEKRSNTPIPESADDFENSGFRRRPKVFHFSDTKLHFSNSFEDKSNTEFKRPPLVNSSSLGTPPNRSIENDLNIFQQPLPRPSHLNIKSEPSKTDANSFSPSTEGDSTTLSDPPCEVRAKSCDYFEGAKVSDNISDERQPKHVSFDSVSVVRSNTISGGLDEEAGPMATSTPHRSKGSYQKKRSQERLLDSTLKTVDIPLIDRTFDESRMRRFARQRRAPMKTQATQTEVVINARLMLPAYLTLSPRATAHVQNVQGPHHKKRGHLTKSKSDHGDFINDSSDDEVMEVDLLSNRPKLIETTKSKGYYNPSKRASTDQERLRDYDTKLKRKSAECLLGAKHYPLSVFEPGASFQADTTVKGKRYVLQNMRAKSDHRVNLSFAGFEDLKERKSSTKIASKSWHNLPLDRPSSKHVNETVKTKSSNRKKHVREKFQIVHLPEFEMATSASEDSSTVTTASTATLKARREAMGHSLPVLEMMTSPDSESATSDFTEQETSCSDVSTISSAKVPLLKQPQDEEESETKRETSESSMYVTANDKMGSDPAKWGRIGHILAEENEENQTSFESFSSISFFSSPPSNKAQSKSSASSTECNDPKNVNLNSESKAKENKMHVPVYRINRGKLKDEFPVSLPCEADEPATATSSLLPDTPKEEVVNEPADQSLVKNSNDIEVESIPAETVDEVVSSPTKTPTPDVTEPSTENDDINNLTIANASESFQKADSYDIASSSRIFDNQIYSKDELSTLSEASNETSQADTMSRASDMQEECAVATPSEDDTLFIRNPSVTSRSFDTLVDKMVSQQDTSCLLGESSHHRKDNLGEGVDMKRAVSFPVLNALPALSSASRKAPLGREALINEMKSGLSSDNLNERRHRRSSSYLSNRSEESLNKSEEKHLTRSDTTYSDDLNTSNISQKDDSSRRVLCCQCGELIREAAFKSSNKSIASVPEEEDQQKTTPPFISRWREVSEIEDEDSGLHEDSFHLSSWIFVGEREEYSAWKQELFDKEALIEDEMQDLPLDLKLCQEKTLGEKDFQKRYRSITHRMIHRKASMEMYKRLASGTLIAEKEISIQRTNEEFGFRIHGSRPVVVSSIEKGTPAETCGLEVGDIILSINESEVVDVSHSEVVRIAHAGTTELHMQIVRTSHILAPVPAPESQLLVDMKGYLRFQTSHDRSQWWKRWFVLRDRRLYWYQSNQDYEPLGVLLLDNGKVESTPETEIANAFNLKISCDCSWSFISDQKDVSRWISAFNNISSKVLKYKIPYLETCKSSLEKAAKNFTNPDCSGYLGKLGHQWKVWRRRYFILKDACLYLYTDQGSTSALGMFLLQGYKVQSCTILNKKNTFEVIPPESHLRHFHFTAESEYNKKRWLAALEYSIDRWMKMKSLRKK